MNKPSTATQTCTLCNQIKALEDFSKDRRRPRGYASRCKVCDQLRRKEYYSRPEIKEREARRRRVMYWEDPKSQRKRRAVYRRNNFEISAIDRDPFKERARRMLRDSVRAGKITKPRRCEKCGASGVIHGHHEDYSKPLDVQWLCVRCHGEAHRKYPDEPLKAAMEAGRHE